MGLVVILLSLPACGELAGTDGGASPAQQRDCTIPQQAVTAIPSGTFIMGQSDVYAEEGPMRAVQLDGFWIDTAEITNAQFANFVQATDYVTVAEQPVDPAVFGVPTDQIPLDMLEPGSAVFTQPAQPSNNFADWWEYRPGANWRKPVGPDGPNADNDRPVVHLASADMEAYAKWRGGRLPSEAEWEYAARAGAENETEQPSEANSWQGAFPVKDFETDGFGGVAPVGCYQANAWGLHDMIGNVWEVTDDVYAPGHDLGRPLRNPRGPSDAAVDPAAVMRVMKGGSYLCAPNYCQRYRPAARSARDPGLGASNVGFRLVYDSEPEPLPAI